MDIGQFSCSATLALLLGLGNKQLCSLVRGPSTPHVHAPRQVTSSLWWGSVASSRAQHWVLIQRSSLGWEWGRLGGFITLDSFLPEQGALCSYQDRYLDVNLPFLPSCLCQSEHLWIYRIHTFLTDTTVILLKQSVETATESYEFPWC